MDKYLLLFRLLCYNLRSGEPLRIRIDVSGDFTVDCVLRYVVWNVLWLASVVDWYIAVAVVFRSTVTTGLEVLWPLSVVSVVKNEVHGVWEVPSDIILVLVDTVNMFEYRVLVVACMKRERNIIELT